MIFKDRRQAGIQLGYRLQGFAEGNVVILALPRGGVPVGYEVARYLDLLLDVIIVRKIGAPGNEEFGIGAVAENGELILDKPTINLLGVSPMQISELINREKQNIKNQVIKFRQGKNLPDLDPYSVVLVDDGLATGITARCALKAVDKLNPKQLIFAAPVCAPKTSDDLSSVVNNVICLSKPSDFTSVGMWYQDFSQLDDQEVINYLEKSKRLMQA